jgi:hypothetical protein
MSQLKLSPEEVEKLGEEIYARDIRDKLSATDKGKFVVIDVTTGGFEIAESDLSASLRMLERKSLGENLYGIRIGYQAAYRLGGHSLSVE